MCPSVSTKYRRCVFLHEATPEQTGGCIRWKPGAAGKWISPHYLDFQQLLALCSVRDEEPKTAGAEQSITRRVRELHGCELQSQLQARSDRSGVVFLFSRPAVIAAARHPQRKNQNHLFASAHLPLTPPIIRKFLLSIFFSSPLLWQLAAVSDPSPAERKQIEHQSFSLKRV